MRIIQQRLSWGTLLVAGIFSIAGFYQWQKSTVPVLDRRVITADNYRFPLPAMPVVIDDNTGLRGRDPFSEKQPAGELPEETISSNLILLGTVTGRNPRAVIAEKANPAKTYIVCPGETCLGEKVDTIGKGYVIIWKEGHRLTISSTP